MLPPKKIDKCFHDAADDISSHDIFSFPTFISILRLLYYILYIDIIILGWEMWIFTAWFLQMWISVGWVFALQISRSHFC
jgi:hypothetical protein